MAEIIRGAVVIWCGGTGWGVQQLNPRLGSNITLSPNLLSPPELVQSSACL
jgi:hypothetical protein